MERCNVCGQENGHAEGCPNRGNVIKEHGGEVRCNFCGTMNPAGSKKCRSCNATLVESMVKGNYQDFSSEKRMPTQSEDSSVVNECCPSCGYVLRPGSRVCPNCQNAKDQAIGDDMNHFVKKGGSPDRNQSIPIWNIDESEFRIGLCDKNGNISNAKSYTGGDVVLGREELAPNDNHISRKHIQITNEGGQWYIEDVSSTNQTYLVVKGKTPIDSGDVLVLGNKFFRFEVK